MWQDVVISVVTALFGVMLIPQIIDSFKGKTVNKVTATLTMFGLYVLCVTFASLCMWFSMLTELFVGAMWMILLILSIERGDINR